MKNIKHTPMIIYVMTFYMKLQLRCIVSNYTDHPPITWCPYIPSRSNQASFLLGVANEVFSCRTAALQMGECWFWEAPLGVSLRSDV